VSNSFYIVCTIVPIRPIIVLFSYSAFGCKSVIINQSITITVLLHSTEGLMPSPAGGRKVGASQAEATLVLLKENTTIV